MSTTWRKSAMSKIIWYLSVALAVLVVSTSVSAQTFTDVTDAAGINYTRVPSPAEARLDDAKVRSTVDADMDGIIDDPFTFPENIRMPFKGRGAPGVAILDYDKDGDLDFYVTNGPGAANSLYSSQYAQTGMLTFVDMGVAAGVAATDHDSTGVCYGDTDNDGDHDLFVLGNTEPNRMYANNGDGTFTNITATSGLDADSYGSVVCSMGDVNNDGLLDIVVGNAFDLSDQFSIFAQDFVLNHPNQVFQNQGNNVFLDVSADSGILEMDGLPDGVTTTITWALGLVDYDNDGDVDLVQMDDQGGCEPEELVPTLVTKGFVHIFENDGTGNFTDMTLEFLGERVWGSWQGVTFGDLNRDGYMDIFGSNLGDYMWQILPPAWNPAQHSSRWLLQQADGTFTDPGVGALGGTPLGWGCTAQDYDNDADTDLIYFGGLDFHVNIEKSNPGTVLQNDGSANFTYDAAALAGSADHSLRNDQGMAAGDLNHDGFVDFITVASEQGDDATVTAAYPILPNTVFDAVSQFLPIFMPIGPGQFTWIGSEFDDGTVTVEINSAANGNGWAELNLYGTVGVTTGGRANRDGIGAVVRFWAGSHPAVMQPILGGASYASQDSLAANFGMGSAISGVAEVTWPGGFRNRLRDISPGERITFPEIPCDYNDQFTDESGYRACVNQALDELVAAGKLDADGAQRFKVSAFDCTAGPNTLCLNNGRFKVEVQWTDFEGASGPGTVTPFDSDESGIFYFFSPQNSEMLVKVLNGCEINSHYWVFGSAATDVAYTLTVTDTVSGEESVYINALGTASPAITDTGAFMTCP